MVNQLPKGWKEEELGKHANIKRGSTITKKQVVHGDYPVVAGGKEAAYYHNEYNRQPPVITVSGSGASAGYVNYWEVPIFASDCSTIEEKDLNIKYIYYFLKSRQQELLDKQVGVAIPHVSPKDVSPLLIPYPTDKGEQKYIVDTLDAVAEMIRLRKETIQLTKDLIPAIFQEMFGDPIRNSKSWKVDRLGNQAKIVGGGTPKTSEPSFWNGDVPWITPKDLSVSNSLTIEHGERFITKEGLKNSNAEMLPAETVLFTSRAPIGYLAIAKNPLCTNQGFKSFICGSNLVPLYLLFYLDQIMDIVKGMASGATFKEISASTAKQIPILCPPMSLQEEFAKKVEQINDNLKFQQKDLDKLQELFDQLLQKAFTGELTRGETIDGVI